MSAAGGGMSLAVRVKVEREWDGAGECGASEAAAAGLYADHEAKDELLLSPERLQPQDIAYTLQQSSLPPSTSTSDQPPKPPPKSQVISGSDLNTNKAQEVLDGWQVEMEVESDEDDEDVPQQTPDYINLEPAFVLPDTLEPAAQEWLSQEDADTDKCLQRLLPFEQLTFQWSSDHTTFLGNREEYRGMPGPTFTMDENTTAIDVFLKFFDDDFLELIVNETNKHSKTIIRQVTTVNSRVNFWHDTDRGEIVIFLAILLFQSLTPLNVEKDYWRENGFLTLKYFKNLMTYNRFVLIKRFLHFTDDDNEMTELTIDERKLRKIRPVLDHLNKKFSSLYFPEQNIAIDESLLKWHGRLNFAQKIATKAKVGIKSHELCELSTGYLWSFLVYTLKGHKHGETDNNTDEQYTENAVTDGQTQRLTTASASSLPPQPTNTTAQIVQQLVKPLLNQGYTLIIDNLYNAPLLARYLKSQQTDCFGTLRINRESVPESFKEISKSEMCIGEVVQSFCRDVSVMMWRDSNIVSMLSTYHQGEVGGKENLGMHKSKPQIVQDYNMAMGSMDKKHQLLSAHKVDRNKNVAWYKKAFRRLLNVTVLNAYIIFKTQHPKITHRAFKQSLAEEMVAKFLPPRLDGPLAVTTNSLMPFSNGLRRPILTGNHFISEGQSKNKRCVWCHKSRSKYICKQCKVSLCLKTCFEEFHTKPRGSVSIQNTTRV